MRSQARSAAAALAAVVVTSALGLGLLGLGLMGLGAGCAGPKRLPPAGAAADRGAADSRYSHRAAEGADPGQGVARGARVPLLLGIGLAEGSADLALQITGPCLVLDGTTGTRLGRLEAADTVLACERSGDLVAWLAGGLAGSAGAVRLRPLDPGHFCGWDGRRYRGELLVLPSPRSGGLTLVNAVELEDYLRGVVPWEIGRHGPDKSAALAAQAVAARTYTISHLGTRAARGFDLAAGVEDQVYQGAGQEDELCNQAVSRTEGLVLQFAGKEIEAFYSACCGGTTAQIEEVWPQPAQTYLVSHPDRIGGGKDPFCSHYPHYRWQEEWTAARLQDILQTTLPAYCAYMQDGGRAKWAGPVFTPKGGKGGPGSPGALRNLEITERTRSGRVARLDVTTAAGVYHVRGDRVRWVLAPADGQPVILRSALFDLKLGRQGDRLTSVRAEGRGYGHGIGLCQAGALAMATAGHPYPEILAHYYPGALLTRAAPRRGNS